MYGSVQLLTPEECDQIVAELEPLPWSDGMAPGELYREKIKRNQEIALDMSPQTKVADELMAGIARKVMESGFIRERVFPKNMVNPRFNLYQNGGSYNKHADSAFLGGNRRQIRSDISATLFLTDPDSYEGGELSLEYASGTNLKIKEPKGTMVFYQSGVMHEVLPVTHGRRICFVAWIESHIQNPQTRDILSEITRLCDDMMDDPDLALSDFHTRALNVKHNLFRLWWHNNE